MFTVGSDVGGKIRPACGLPPEPDLSFLRAAALGPTGTSERLEFFQTKGKTFGDMATELSMYFSKLEVDCNIPCSKVQFSGGVFPLPDSPSAIVEVLGQIPEDQLMVLSGVCKALNSYNGSAGAVRPVVSAAARMALDGLAANVRDSQLCGQKFEGLAWDDFLTVRTVDYRGEEVKVAKTFSWANIEPALPEGIGSIPLTEVCERGTLDYVVNFEKYLLPEESRVYTKPPRVFVMDHDWEQVCSGLLSKGVCRMIPKSEVYHINNLPILNGLFGVSKSEFHHGVETHRLIMNLVPANKLCRNLGADLATLPAVTGLSGIVLGPEQFLVMSSEDIRHPKKSVQQELSAEIQGAMVNGETGKVRPKPEKILKYADLAMGLLRRGEATQKQMQIVCGGLVYCAMFRRPMLGMLNAVWKFIMEFEGDPPVVRRPLPSVVQLEFVRFLCALPLAQMNLRTLVRGDVSVSDASEWGGGFCMSNGLTPMGAHAAQCAIRGDLPEPEDHIQVLTVGLFDGIGALRVGADALKLPMGGHVSAEVSGPGNRVLESNFPDCEQVGDVSNITDEMVHTWAVKYSNVGVVLVGGGPPCQGVSGLNADRKGALRDARSNLFVHVRRVYLLVKKHFVWAQVHGLMESVFSMDEADRAIMSEHMESLPYLVDAEGVTICRRPRLYWITWALREAEGVTVEKVDKPGWKGYNIVKLNHPVNPAEFLLKGWTLGGSEKLPTFTTSRPRAAPGNRPAGLWQCTTGEVDRWKKDCHRFPPYVYRDVHCLVNSSGEHRLPTVQEKEVSMGFPVDYTAACLPKSQQKGEIYMDTRHTLIGNSWNVMVITWLLKELFAPLGLTSLNSLGDVVRATSPGGDPLLQGYLRRPSLVPVKSTCEVVPEDQLVKKLVNFVSVKGEDLLLQADSENQVKFHRFENIELPKQSRQMDSLVADYVEHLWASGAGRALAADTVAGLQNVEPHLKNHMPTVWRLLKVWSQNELPNRAPPMPEVVVHAIVGRALLKNDPEFGLSILLGYYGMMRTGEILNLKPQNVEVAGPTGPAILSLGLTKSGKRQGAAESITVSVFDVADQEPAPGQRLIEIFHCDRSSQQAFAQPFLLLVAPGEKSGSIKQRCKAKLQVPDSEFKSWRPGSPALLGTCAPQSLEFFVSPVQTQQAFNHQGLNRLRPKQNWIRCVFLDHAKVDDGSGHTGSG
eukprot:s17_g27.t1